MIKRKKIMFGLLAVSIVAICAVLVNKVFINKNQDDIKVIAYKEPEISSDSMNEDGYKINKFENINAVEWINGNEVLTLTDKTGGYNPIHYCSIYNLNSKESIDFKDVSIASNGYFGLSNNKKYLLYAEEKEMVNYYENVDGKELTDEQKKSNEEFKTQELSGDLRHKNIKILNIESGEITDLKTQKVNSDADYRWISDDKILIIYNNSNNGWEILNLKGEVCAEGTFDYSSSFYSSSSIVGAQDLKDIGDNNVEGHFYYTKNYEKEDGSVGERVYKVNVDTKKEELVYGIETEFIADKKGDLIVTDFANNNEEKNEGKIKGYYEHRTFGINIFNIDKNLLQSLELAEGVGLGKYKLSHDGSKLGYIQSLKDYVFLGTMDNEINQKTILSVMNVKSGKIKEVVKLSDLKDNSSNEYESVNMSNLSWSDNNKSLMFTCDYKINKKYTIKLDEIGKEMYQTDEDEKEISSLEHAKSNTYIVTFDN